jgi:tetratricopeptide (TPR) repeat protein
MIFHPQLSLRFSAATTIALASVMMNGMAQDAASTLPSAAAPDILATPLAATAGTMPSGTETPEQLSELAALQLKMGKSDESLATVARILRTNPTHVAGNLIAGRVHLKEGRAAEALVHSEALLSSEPDHADGRLLKATALVRLDRKPEAEPLFADAKSEDLNRWREEFPLATKDADVLPSGLPATIAPQEASVDPADRELEGVRRAIAAKDAALAEQLSVAALERYPDHSEAVALRATVLVEAKQFPTAVALLEAAKAKHNDQSGPFEADLDLAYALQEVGRSDDALALFTTIVRDKRVSQENRTIAAGGLKELRHSALLEKGERALDEGKLEQCETISKELVALAPECPHALRMRANVLAKTGKPDEAVRIFTVLKNSAKAGEKFDPQIEYAAALASSTRYSDAIRAYQEVITRPELYSADELKMAKDESKTLAEETRPRMLVEWHGGKFGEGKINRGSSSFSSARFGANRFHAGFLWDAITLDSKGGEMFPSDKDEERYTAFGGWSYHPSSNLYFTSLLGGSTGNVLGSLAGEFNGADGVGGTLRFAYNDPARDTLLLEAMDGRQHVASLNLRRPIGDHFAVDVTGLLRRVEIEGEEVGSGFKGEAQFRWHPFKDEPRMYLAYNLEIAEFSADEKNWDAGVSRFFGVNNSGITSDSVVIPSIQRHSLQAHAGGDLSSNWSYAMLGEVAWRQETEQAEYGLLGELFWHLSENADLNVRMEYYSGGAGPNSDGSVVLGTAGLKVSW